MGEEQGGGKEGGVKRERENGRKTERLLEGNTSIVFWELTRDINGVFTLSPFMSPDSQSPSQKESHDWSHDTCIPITSYCIETHHMTLDDIP